MADLVAACEAAGERSVNVISRLLCYEALAEASARLDRFDEAATWASRAAAIGCPELAAHRGLIVLAEAHADPGAGVDRALRAAEELDRAGLRVLAARARLRAGVLIGDTDRDRALALLSEAAGVFAASGARGRHEEAVRAQRRLGVRVPRRGSGRVAGQAAALSTRELQVARLVAHGLTNREIARRLHISPRTVETHLAHAYAKLGVRSRAELTNLLVELW